MRAVDVIQKKRDGAELLTEEINYMVDAYSRGQLPDYQMSAFAMAIYFKGMTARETADLTMAMVNSGEQVDLSSIKGVKVDKHSTGGVGDTTTLVLAPLVAAAGVPVAKMSGRGLGHTGGTIDKLEAVPGFSVELTKEQFLSQVNDVGIAVISQTGNITPADKKLYALRDVTATVDSIPLIASSIMSKKIASGADAIVLDVKTGDGAFMKDLEDSIELAQAMVEIGEHVGRETVAVITGMEEPLGLAVGNSLEIIEAIDTLNGKGPEDLAELCMVLGSHMLRLGGAADTVDAARAKLAELMASGDALVKFKDFLGAQGGDATVVDEPSNLPQASRVVLVEAPSAGYVGSIAAEAIGVAAMMLGAGRATKESSIDLGVGVLLRKKVADRVEVGDVLAELHVGEGSDEAAVAEVHKRVLEAYGLSEAPQQKPQLIYAIVTKSGVERL
ncbi:pyrimidine-nucleoside phosphorylase [Paenibacillus sp. N1-5-1-14]|uniref:pyrimidine-nucleoside phosphorylase n=1 Tax=Paenibacillus radicibacter TaxID=2972488 RepID=UPI002158DB77|nr:pyrimidine-nucleoside phosphorylase [Paenibacillus radicibacter]MCR8642362.1 pyrimidine-nucleoside phosphorylase [Paenibacillus radicibacter]